MAGKGRKVMFHGSFTRKADAKRKERRVGGYVKRVKVRGVTRYTVITRRRGK